MREGFLIPLRTKPSESLSYVGSQSLLSEGRFSHRIARGGISARKGGRNPFLVREGFLKKKVGGGICLSKRGRNPFLVREGFLNFAGKL